MYYVIFAKKGNKAFCYPVDNVEKTTYGYYFRDVKHDTFHYCSKSNVVENPTFTGREYHGYKEIILT